MEGVIKNFRRGRTTQKTNHMIVYLDDVSSREKASGLVGKEVVWKSTKGKEINGKVARPHGNKGAIRVIFEKGLPGQSLGTKVEVK